jgi:class 3 adenylate cyclase
MSLLPRLRKAVTAACPNCGFVNEPGEKYCGGCGHPLALAETRSKPGGAPAAPSAGSEGERRQVTVLFCDLAGYTRLTHELGAEAVHDMTDRFFGLVDGLIEQFGGSIDKHIGDCAMSVFGAPVAHGNDPERAVRAALAIRDAMPDLSREFGRELNVHVGIASGQVVASGGAGHKIYSITGDSVNLASRLTGAAAAGIILISDAVRHMLPPGYIFQEAGTLAVKGLSEPVTAWRLIGFGEAAREERPFVGSALRSPSSGTHLAPVARAVPARQSSCAVRRGSARPAWARSSRRRRQPRASPAISA